MSRVLWVDRFSCLLLPALDGSLLITSVAAKRGLGEDQETVDTVVDSDIASFRARFSNAFGPK
jgi:hypothetical protein